MGIIKRGNTRQRRLAAIGMFDGVHRGHRYLIDFLRSEATRLHLTPSVVTFRNHPMSVVRPDAVPESLTSVDDRMSLLNRAGADDVILLDFDNRMRHMTARRFLSMLKKRFGIDALVVGFNNRFGRDRVDGIDQYRAIGHKIGMEIIGAPEYRDDTQISSSVVRSHLRQGDIDSANTALGYNYRFSGIVTEGKQIGRTIGFPTANIAPLCPEILIPAPGAYAVIVTLPDGSRHGGMLNIGFRPTVDHTEHPRQTVEVNIFDFDGRLYGSTIDIEFIARLRAEKKFASIDKLRSQLASDARKARKLVKKLL